MARENYSLGVVLIENRHSHYKDSKGMMRFFFLIYSPGCSTTPITLGVLDLENIDWVVFVRFRQPWIFYFQIVGTSFRVDSQEAWVPRWLNLDTIVCSKLFKLFSPRSWGKVIEVGF